MSRLRKAARVSLKSQMKVTDIITTQGDIIRKEYILELEDISVGGLRYKCKFPIPIGTKLKLIIPIAQERVSCIIEVLWSMRTEGGYSIGSRCVYMNATEEQKVLRYVSNMLAKGSDEQKEARYMFGGMQWDCPACACMGCYCRYTCHTCTGDNCYKNFCWRRFPYHK